MILAKMLATPIELDQATNPSLIVVALSHRIGFTLIELTTLCLVCVIILQWLTYDMALNLFQILTLHNFSYLNLIEIISK